MSAEPRAPTSHTPAWHQVADRVKVLAPAGDGPGLAAFLDATRHARAEPFAVLYVNVIG